MRRVSPPCWCQTEMSRCVTGQSGDPGEESSPSEGVGSGSRGREVWGQYQVGGSQVLPDLARQLGPENTKLNYFHLVMVLGQCKYVRKLHYQLIKERCQLLFSSFTHYHEVAPFPYFLVVKKS